MKNVLLFFLLLSGSSLFGQGFTMDWAKTYGGVKEQFPMGVVVDAAGNVFTLGFYQGNVDFETGTGTHSIPPINEDYSVELFLTKTTANGSLVWVKRIAGIDFKTVKGNSIAIDGDGNLYLAGIFNGRADFDPGPGVYELAPTKGVESFFMKLNNDGEFQWVKKIESIDVSMIYNKMINRIRVDNHNNIYIAGEYEGTTDFDTGAGVYALTPNHGADMFVAKYDPSGNFIWAKSFGGEGSEFNEDVAVDSNGDVYVVGHFSRTVDFDSGAGVYELSSTGAIGYLLKLNSNGDFQWVKKLADDPLVSGMAIPYNVEVDGVGGVILSGYFTKTLALDANNPSAYLTVFAGVNSHDVFVAKWDAQGNFLWNKQLGGTGRSFCYGMTLSPTGNIFLTGHFQAIMDFDPGVGVYNIPAVGSFDAFIAKLDRNGNFQGAGSFGGVNVEYASAIAVDTAEKVYAAGRFFGTVDFDPGAGTSMRTSIGTSIGVMDAYVGKYSFSTCEVGRTDVKSACDSYTWIDGVTYFASTTTATHRLVGAAGSGCDSLITLNLTINEATQAAVSVSNCGAYRWSLNGQTYSTSGVYTHVLPNAKGCDSTVTLNLTINEATQAAVSVSNCGAYRWSLNGQTYSTSGVYTHVLPNVKGCDSTVTLNLTIVELDNTVQVTGTTLTANQNNAIYQWVDCGNGSTPISGATAQTFIPALNGSYAVKITGNGCTVVSECVTVHTVNVSTLEKGSLNIYPNPSKGVFMISSDEKVEGMMIEIYSPIGQLIYEAPMQDKEVSVDLSDQPNGVYLVKMNLSIVRIVLTK